MLELMNEDEIEKTEKLSERIDREQNTYLEIKKLGGTHCYVPAFGDLKRLAETLEAENELLREALAEDDSSLHARVREAESAATGLRWLISALAAQAGGELRIDKREIVRLRSGSLLSMWDDLQSNETVIAVTKDQPERRLAPP